MEGNNLAENRVSLSIFNYHTWIEYENFKKTMLTRPIKKAVSLRENLAIYQNNKGQKYKKY